MQGNCIDSATQTMPDNGHEKLVIPISLKAPKGSTVTFAAAITDLPPDIPVYLEDRLNGKYCPLDEPGSSYSVTLNLASDGTGRFFLVTSPLITGDDRIQVELFTIIPFPREQKILITGKVAPSAVVSLYTLDGQKVSAYMLNGDFENEIRFEPTIKGIYIFRLQTGNTVISRKINWTF